MERKTVTIKGQDYVLPPFNTGQMKRHVDPLLKRARALLKATREADEGDLDAFLGLEEERRSIESEHGTLVAMAIKNAYPNFEQADLDDLTPRQVTNLFNQVLAVTTTGANEPGEPKP
jgi:hypothetical protein